MSNKGQALLARCPVRFEKKVEWGDMDAMQHVNNVRYFYYAESARLQLLAEMLPAFAEGTLADQDEVYTLAETGCRFKVSLTWPDTITIGSGVESIDDTSFIVRHILYSHKLALVAAELTARMVRYNPVQRCRASIPARDLELLENYRLREPAE